MFRSELTEADLEEELGPPGEPTCRGSVEGGVLSLICTFSFCAVTGASSISISRAIVRTNSNVMVIKLQVTFGE